MGRRHATHIFKCIRSGRQGEGFTLRRPASTLIRASREDTANAGLKQCVEAPSALSRLPATSILRGIILGNFLTSPILSRPGFAFLQKLAVSQNGLLNPDKNPVLRAIVKPLVYNHFCAGTHETEIKGRIAGIRSLGFSGVLLAYGKEIQIYNRSGNDTSHTVQAAAQEHDEEVEMWKKGNLETIAMLKDDDFLAMKLSGAGVATANALLHNEEAPKQLNDAMDEICQAAIRRKVRIIVDAEQQFIQRAIDTWTLDWMRKYNASKAPLIYNTLQAYLKESRQKLQHQLSLAQKEGWTLAIKLVRGAYISNDIRERIHDTKTDTDNSYNSIVKDVLEGTLPLPGAPNGQKFPEMRIFLAGHNQTSVNLATALVDRLTDEGRLKVVPEFGQLQGMADELGCNLLKWSEARHPLAGQLPVRVYKYMTWGSTQECMEYLYRRAVENKGAADRMADDMTAMRKELVSRFWSLFRVGRRRSGGAAV